MLELIRFVLSALFTLAGLFVLVSGVVGVFRFRYSMNRMHAAALGDTLGILCVLLGVMIAEGLTIATVKMLLVIITLWLTSPVASHLVSRLEVTINDHLERHMNVVDKTAVVREKEGIYHCVRYFRCAEQKFAGGHCDFYEPVSGHERDLDDASVAGPGHHGSRGRRGY